MEPVSSSITKKSTFGAIVKAPLDEGEGDGDGAALALGNGEGVGEVCMVPGNGAEEDTTFTVNVESHPVATMRTMPKERRVISLMAVYRASRVP
jgi:hypothetical protein